jgi:pyruvate, water dikinase
MTRGCPVAEAPKAFPLPSSIAVIPGTEAAQAAYPYYTAFVPGDDGKFWFYNSMHFPEPMHHFDMITAEAAYVALGAANTRVHVLPTAKGIEHRVINGRVYIGGVSVTDPEEIAERVGEFQQRAFYYYEHWERLYDEWKVKMKTLIADAQALPTPSLPPYEPLENVHAGKGIAANHDLLTSGNRSRTSMQARAWRAIMWCSRPGRRRSRATSGCGTTTSSSCCSATART